MLNNRLADPRTSGPQQAPWPVRSCGYSSANPRWLTFEPLNEESDNGYTTVAYASQMLRHSTCKAKNNHATVRTAIHHILSPS